MKKDKVVEAVRCKLKERSDVGQKKYGTTMERTDLSFDQWLQHAQEELMDGAVYLERVRRDWGDLGELLKKHVPIQFALRRLVIRLERETGLSAPLKESLEFARKALRGR